MPDLVRNHCSVPSRPSTASTDLVPASGVILTLVSLVSRDADVGTKQQISDLCFRPGGTEPAFCTDIGPRSGMFLSHNMTINPTPLVGCRPASHRQMPHAVFVARFSLWNEVYASACTFCVLC